MDKPGESVEHLYFEHNCNGISVWINSNIDEKAVSDLKIGYKKFLFFGEITVSGIPSEVLMQ